MSDWSSDVCSSDLAIWGQSDAPFDVPLLGFAMGSDGVPGVSLQEAGKAVAFYWGGAMVGRAIGSILLARVSAARLLALSTAIDAMLCLYVVTVGDRKSVVEGKSVSVRVDLGGRGIIKKKKKQDIS